MSSVKLATAMVQVTASGIPDVVQEFNQLKSGIAGVFDSIASAAKTALAGAAIYGLFQGKDQFIADAKEAVDAETRLAAVIKATGGAARLSQEELLAFAAERQDLTQFGGDATVAAMSQLLTFKSIAGDTFKETMRLAQDLSATGFGSLESATVQLGKALEDPAQGMAALRRVGVSFTEAEQEKIKALQESGDLLGAQNVILAAVRGQVGGVAEAMAKTDFGRFAQLNEILGDLGEEIGKRLVPYQNKWLEIQIAIREVTIQVMDVVGQYAEQIAEATKRVLAGVAALKAMQLAMQAVSFGALNLSRVLKVALASTGWGLLVVALGSVAVWLYEIGVQAAKMENVQAAWTESVREFGYAWEIVKETAATVFDALMSGIESLAAMFGVSVESMPQTVSEVMVATLDIVSDFAMDAAEWFKVIVENWTTVWELMKVTALVILSSIVDFFGNLPEAMFQSWGFGVRKLIDLLSGFVNWFIDAFSSAMQAVGNMIAGLPAMVAAAFAGGGGIGNAIQMALNNAMAAQQAKLNAFMAGFVDGEAPDFFKPSQQTMDLLEEQKRLFGELLDAKTELEGGRENRLAPVRPPTVPEDDEEAIDGKASRETKVGKPDIKLGFGGLTDLSRQIQESFIKQADPMEKLVGLSEQSNGIQGLMLDGINKLVNKPPIAQAE